MSYKDQIKALKENDNKRFGLPGLDCKRNEMLIELKAMDIVHNNPKKYLDLAEKWVKEKLMKGLSI
jgi:hypothetical protein